MFWIFILVVGTSAAFIRLGSLSVWTSVFTFGLKLAFLVITLITVTIIWKHFKVTDVFKKTNIIKK